MQLMLQKYDFSDILFFLFFSCVYYQFSCCNDMFTRFPIIVMFPEKVREQQVNVMMDAKQCTSILNVKQIKRFSLLSKSNKILPVLQHLVSKYSTYRNACLYFCEFNPISVSYTHLTLPTICSV